MGEELFHVDRRTDGRTGGRAEGRKDRHNEANSHFSQFLELAYKTNIVMKMNWNESRGQVVVTPARKIGRFCVQLHTFCSNILRLWMLLVTHFKQMLEQYRQLGDIVTNASFNNHPCYCQRQ